MFTAGGVNSTVSVLVGLGWPQASVTASVSANTPAAHGRTRRLVKFLFPLLTLLHTSAD
jgi:hypothetical protein